MIIVEGPDNSGKTTLVKQLHDDLDLISFDHPHGPPKNSDELVSRTANMLMKIRGPRVIADRTPLIGEVIYGSIMRDHNMWTEKESYYKMLKDIFLKAIKNNMVFLIYCRPPDEKVLNFDTHEVKSYDTLEHLKGLEIHKRKILKAYDELLPSIASATYDYTKEGSYKQLTEKLRKEYFHECK